MTLLRTRAAENFLLMQHVDCTQDCQVGCVRRVWFLLAILVEALFSLEQSTLYTCINNQYVGFVQFV